MKINLPTILASMLTLLSISAFSGEIKITEAIYGAGDKTVNVTEKVKQLALAFGENPDFIVITANNSLAPKDPAHGIAKTLVIKYTDSGIEKSKSIAEKQTGYIGSDINLTKEFSLLKAYYGGKDKWKDVTALVEKLLQKQGNQEISNAAMGGDPIHGVAKNLYIYYSKDNKLHSKILKEKTKFNFSSLNPQPKSE